MDDGVGRAIAPTAQGRGPTRRGFIAGLGLGAAAQLAPLGLHTAESLAAGPDHCTPNAPGLRAVALAAPAAGGAVWRTDSTARTITELRGRTPAPSRALEVGGAPVAIAVDGAGTRAVVATAAYDQPGLAIADLRAARLLDRVDVGRDPAQVALSRDGRTAVVTGGGAHGTLTRVDLSSGRVHAPVAVGRHPRGVALSPDGDHAYVAVNGDGVVAVVALRRNRVVQRFATAAWPSRIAIAPTGRTALVTHDGAGTGVLTPIDLVARRARRAVRVGADPSGVAFEASGALAAVALCGAGGVALIDARTGRPRKVVPTGGSPRALAGARRAFYALDWKTGTVTRIAARARRTTPRSAA